MIRRVVSHGYDNAILYVYQINDNNEKPVTNLKKKIN